MSAIALATVDACLRSTCFQCLEKCTNNLKSAVMVPVFGALRVLVLDPLDPQDFVIAVLGKEKSPARIVKIIALIG